MGQCLRNLLGLLTILGLEVGAWSVEPTSAVDPVRQVAFTFDDLPAVRPRGLENTQALTAALVGRIAAEGIPAVGFVNEGKLADLGLDAAAGAALLEPRCWSPGWRRFWSWAITPGRCAGSATLTSTPDRTPPARRLSRASWSAWWSTMKTKPGARWVASPPRCCSCTPTG